MNDSDRRNNIFACAVAMVLAKRDDNADVMVKCGKALDNLVCDDDIEYAQGWAETTDGMEGMAKMLRKKTGKEINKEPTKKAKFSELKDMASKGWDKLTHEQQIYVVSVSMAKDMRDANIGKVLESASKLSKIVKSEDWDKARELLGVAEYDTPTPDDEHEEPEDGESKPDLKERGDSESFSM